MKHRILITTLASVMLASGIGAVTTPTHTTSAATHSVYSSYWNKNRKVRVIRKTTFRRFDARKGRIVKGRKTFKPGRVITVRSAGEFVGWVLAGTRPGSRYWWISTKPTSNWMKEYHKVYASGWNGNTFTKSNGTKLTVNGITKANYKQGSYKHALLLLNVTLKYNGNGTTTVYDYLNKNFIVGFPNNKDDVIFAANADDVHAMISGHSDWRHLISVGSNSIIEHGETKTAIIPYRLSDSKSDVDQFTIEDYYDEPKAFTAQNDSFNAYGDNPF